MEEEVTIKFVLDEKGHILRVLDIHGNRLDKPLHLKSEVETCVKEITTFRLGSSMTCTYVNHIFTCAPGLC